MLIATSVILRKRSAPVTQAQKPVPPKKQEPPIWWETYLSQAIVAQAKYLNVIPSTSCYNCGKGLYSEEIRWQTIPLSTGTTAEECVKSTPTARCFPEHEQYWPKIRSESATTCKLSSCGMSQRHTTDLPLLPYPAPEHIRALCATDRNVSTAEIRCVHKAVGAS